MRAFEKKWADKVLHHVERVQAQLQKKKQTLYRFVEATVQEDEAEDPRTRTTCEDLDRSAASAR